IRQIWANTFSVKAGKGVFDPVSGNHQRARVMACARARQLPRRAGMRKNVITRQLLSESFRLCAGAVFFV
ncbi:hypothetical protein, partial [Burkholderia arboris]|uniref:hypothetical protein n=1 Tax=Burkholderia arboris TaxID=488730 RepID=UPI001C2ED6C6